MNRLSDVPEPIVLVLLVVLTLFSFLIGGGLSQMWQNGRWEKETVKRGVAQYNSQTGVWEWKTPPCLPVEEKL